MKRTRAPYPRIKTPKYLNALRACALLLIQHEANADDLVQDTIMKTWSDPKNPPRRTNPRAWLFTLLRNSHSSDQRKRRREITDTNGSFAARRTKNPIRDSRWPMAGLQHSVVSQPDEYLKRST